MFVKIPRHALLHIQHCERKAEEYTFLSVFLIFKANILFKALGK